MFSRFIARIVRWYDGEHKVREGFKTGRIVVFPSFYTEYHWTAKAARSVVKFVCVEWKWVVTTVIAVLAIVFTL